MRVYSRAGSDLFCLVADVIFTRGSLSNTMLHHMMEAQASATWELLETTTRGRVLACTDTGGGKRHCVPSYTQKNPKQNRGTFYFSSAHHDGAIQSGVLEPGLKLDDVELLHNSAILTKTNKDV